MANTIFGGLAEYVALLMKQQGIKTTFFWYVSEMGAVAFVVSLLLHKRGKGIQL